MSGRSDYDQATCAGADAVSGDCVERFDRALRALAKHARRMRGDLSGDLRYLDTSLQLGTIRERDEARAELRWADAEHSAKQARLAVRNVALAEERDALRAALREALDGWAHAVDEMSTDDDPDYDDIDRLRKLVTP